jgi:hypothetical protein
VEVSSIHDQVLRGRLSNKTLKGWVVVVLLVETVVAMVGRFRIPWLILFLPSLPDSVAGIKSLLNKVA